MENDSDAYSERLLKDFIKKRIFTTGIGAIDDIEENFKDFIEANEDLWKKLRKNILDRVNYQYKLAEDNVKLFNINAKHKITLIGIMKENKNEDRRN